MIYWNARENFRVPDRGSVPPPRLSRHPTYRLQSVVVEYAILKGLCENNPSSGRSKYIQPYEPKNRKHLKREEVPDFLSNLRAEDDNSQMKWLVSLMFLTMTRPVEAREAKWSEIDLEKALWIIPAERGACGC